MSLYVTQAEWDRWEAERVERARADRERTAWQNKQPSIDRLMERIEELEDRLFVRGVALDAARELLDRRADQDARTRELVDVIVRCDEILAADDDRPSLAVAA